MQPNYLKNPCMTRLLAVLTILFSVPVFGQTDADLIRKTVNNLFDGMKHGDTALIRASFTSKPILQTVVLNKEGKTLIFTEPVDSFISFTAKPHKEVYDERITFESIKIDGPLAMVWAPYKFYLGNKFSHCGVDSFQMVKIDGIWKIQYLVDTRRKEGCSD